MRKFITCLFILKQFKFWVRGWEALWYSTNWILVNCLSCLSRRRIFLPLLYLLLHMHTCMRMWFEAKRPFFTKLLLVKVFYHDRMKLGHVSCHSESPDQEPKSSLLHRVASVRYLLIKMSKVTIMVSFSKGIETPQVEMQKLGTSEL